MQLGRIRRKLEAKGVTLAPPLSDDEVRRFECMHQISLPEPYRDFVTTIGNCGSGPPHFGLVRLGDTATDMHPDQRHNWNQLPKIRDTFPFTVCWVWESGDISAEGTRGDIEKGNLYLGSDGCGMYWHLIITGPDRGIPWMICGEGIQPVCPKRNFLQWYEDWLDGRDSFYGFPA